MSFHHHHSNPFDPFFPFAFHPASSPSHNFHRHSSLIPPPSPFLFPPSTRHLDHRLWPTHPQSLHYDPFLLDSGHAAHCHSRSHDRLELSPFFHGCPAFHRACQHEVEGDRKYKWVAKVKSDGKRTIKYTAKVEVPQGHGSWSSGKVKLIKEANRKRCHERWPYSCSCKGLIGEELEVFCPKEEKQDKGCCSHS